MTSLINRNALGTVLSCFHTSEFNLSIQTFLWVCRKYSKVVPVFNFVPHHEDVWESVDIAPCILDLGTRRRWVVSLEPRPQYRSGNSPPPHHGTYWIRDWEGPRACLNAVAKIKDPRPSRESNPGHQPVVQSLCWRGPVGYGVLIGYVTGSAGSRRRTWLFVSNQDIGTLTHLKQKQWLQNQINQQTGDWGKTISRIAWCVVWTCAVISLGHCPPVTYTKDN